MKLHTALATLFGIGWAPVASGTVASIPAVLLAWPIALETGRIGLGIATLVASVVGIWACEQYVRETKQTDPSECVIDELAGQWVACLFAPLSLLAYLAAFFLFRVFDVVKPWPISRLERLPGGLGIMADDLAAGLVAGIIVAGLAHWGLV